MSANAQRLRLRCFIEGVEVPIIAAQVEARPNSPVAASIQIPPLAEGTRFLPRSLVHVFFYDFYGTTNPLAYPKGETNTPSGAASPSAYELASADREGTTNIDFLQDANNVHYKLLFVGEMVGFQWTKTPVNRSLVLQCVDLSNYWDYAYQFNNTDIFGPGFKAAFSGGATNLFTNFLTDEGSVILQLLRQPSRNYPALKGLLGGLISVLEGIGGVYNDIDQIGGINIFFSIAELRLHITQMITAYDKDPTSHNLINATGYGGLFGRTLGNLGSQVSFRKAINALQGMIFHETFGQPCPLYVPGTNGTVSGKQQRRAIPLTDLPDAEFAVAGAKQIQQSCDALTARLADVVFGTLPGKASDIKASTLTYPTGAAQRCTQILNQLGASRVSGLHVLKPFFTRARALFQQILGTLKTRWGGKAVPNAVLTALQSSIARAREQMTKALAASIPIPRKGPEIPARLQQQIFRPDVWFTPPPRCNVLFPDQYTQMSYMRSFLAEPTRFLLKTNNEFFGEDNLFDRFFFAPKAPTPEEDKATLRKLLKNGMMEHELFTGILPVFEKMGELNIFAAQSGTENGKQQKIGLAQRSTNFLYFKYRFAARQMSIEARFNPYLACGFPGLIVDRYADGSAVERYQTLRKAKGPHDPDLVNALGTHFLGNFTTVTHAIDQQHGSTSIQVGYTRQYEESVEFLGTVEQEQTVKTRISNDALRKTVVAAVTPPGVGSLGPNYGVVARTKDVTQAYRARDLTSGPFFPLYRGPRKRAGEGKIKVPCGLQARAQDYGPEVAAFLGSSTQTVTFKAIEVTEEVPRYRAEKIDLPVEEYIRPGWYGPCWKPKEVGKVYDFFFKTGSITDQTQIADPQGASTGGLDVPASDALAESARTGNPFTSDDQGNVALLALDADASIQQAVQFLILTYSYIKQAGDINVDDFIKAYTWRPIASMVDMFGTANLQLSNDGSKVVQGFEGIHSRAFGPYADLFGLVTPLILHVLNIDHPDIRTKKLDTRKRKQDQVLAYVAALQLSRSTVG